MKLDALAVTAITNFLWASEVFFLAGLQIKSYWDGDETVTRFTPRPQHTAIPGYVYGGLIASLIDCHSTGTA